MKQQTNFEMPENRNDLPWHRLPVEDNTKPSGHRHLKLPGVLLHVPRAQISGCSTHSSMSVRKVKDMRNKNVYAGSCTT